jgi:hypothetical protein
MNLLRVESPPNWMGRVGNLVHRVILGFGGTMRIGVGRYLVVQPRYQSLVQLHL